MICSSPSAKADGNEYLKALLDLYSLLPETLKPLELPRALARGFKVKKEWL